MKPQSREEAVQPLRERNMSRVVKGAQAIGKTVDELSNRQRRLLSAVTDLPPLWESTRADRGEGEVLSRDLATLRQRLEWLVRLEQDFGEDQRGCHVNRAERNALIRVLSDQAARVGIEVQKPPPPGSGERYKPEYVDELHDMAAAAMEDGYVRTLKAQPGVLLHREAHVPPITVPIGAWFFVRGATRGQEGG